MRISILALITAASIAVLAGVSLAASDGPDDVAAACAALPADAGPIDLNAIPAQPADNSQAGAVTGLDQSCLEAEDDDGPGLEGRDDGDGDHD
jgi:hypothetical protein